MKKTLLLSAITALFIGCGSSDSSTTSTAQEVTVERGPIIRAIVIDANGQIAQEVGNGKYKFKNKPAYPLKATGGFIDINRNNILDEGDVSNTLIYHNTDSEALTIVSSIAKDDKIRQYLRHSFNLTDNEIDDGLPQNNDKISAISDVLYSYCVEKNISDPLNLSLSDVENVENDIDNRLNLYNKDTNKALLEKDLVENLPVHKLTKEDVEEISITGDNINTENMQNIINNLPKENLSQENKDILSHMWNEEKLAHDLYLKLYDLYPVETLNTIATRSEARHEESIQNLIEKYDLNITSQDFNGSYNTDELAKYDIGEFISPSIQTLYNNLYDLGSKSEIDALKVGCMVEVTDVNDLDEYINENNITTDMSIVFDHLRNGSYHHYWAFDAVLKSKGITNGCCSVGEEYCKTEEEYPKSK